MGLSSHKPTQYRSIRHLQQTIGNQAVQRLLHGSYEGLKHDSGTTAMPADAKAPVKTKPTVNTPGDVGEQEADRVGEQAIRMPDPKLQHLPVGRRLIDPDDALEQEANPVTDHVLRKPASPAGRQEGEDSPRAHSASSDLAGVGGQPLSKSVRSYFEPRFGRDFGRVNVHTDDRAASAAHALDAQAFSVGHDIVFARDAYRPETAAGKTLLAHELAHVVQQTTGRAAPGVIQRKKRSEAKAPEPGVKETSYAVFFGRGDQYQIGAKLYMKAWYPGHRHLDALSFEDMFVKLAADLRSRRAAGEALWIEEIALVTHAVAGGLMIPLSEEDRKRGDRDKGDLEFTPEDVVALQKRYGERALARLRNAREEVIAAFKMGHTRIVVRGCNFGQSSQGLTALRDFFGGRVTTYAPKHYQVFQVLSLGSKEDRGALEELGITDAASAYDFLVEQRYFTEPDDETLVRAGAAAEGVAPTEAQRRRYKAKYVEDKFGKPPVIPVEAYIAATARETGGESEDEREARRDDAEQKKQRLRRKEKRIVFRKEVDELVLEPREIEDFLPAERPSAEEYKSKKTEQWEGGRVWGRISVESGESDPAIDGLSTDELIRRAAALRNPYRPENASMLVRLLDSYVRRGELWHVPLSRASEYFGDEDQIARDAALHPGPAAYDVLHQQEPLNYRTPAPEERAQAEADTRRARELAEEIKIPAHAAARVQRPVGERDFDARGRVETLPDGGLRLWNFAVNSAVLRSQFKAPLLELARQLASRHDVNLTISGHTSTSGDEGPNEDLAETRAKHVFDALAAAGMPPSAMTPTGYGERLPLVAERKRGTPIPRNMARNRRVEVRLVKVSTLPAKPAPATPPQTGGKPSLKPIELIDAIAIKYEYKPKQFTVVKKLGILNVTAEPKLTFEGEIGLHDATKKLKFNPTEKKAAFEAAIKTELGDLRFEGEVQDGKVSKIKLGLPVTDWFDIDFAAASDFTRPFSVEFKSKAALVKFRAGDWAFSGEVSGSVVFHFGPDRKVVASLAKRGGQPIVRALARSGVALEGLVFTELGTVTTVGAVAVGVGVALISITMLGYFLYKIGGANIEGRVLAGARQFAWGYSHMLMQLTHEAGVNAPLKEKVDKWLSIDWQAQFNEKANRWVQDEDKAALNGLYYVAEAAVAQDYNRYVRLYGDAQWSKLATAHRAKYGENYQTRENNYRRIVLNQLEKGESTFGVPLEINP